MTKTRFLASFALVFFLLSGVWAAKPGNLSPSGQEETRSLEKSTDAEGTTTRDAHRTTQPSSPSLSSKAEDTLPAAASGPQVTPAGTEAAYQIPWKSVNGGGNPGTSTSYMLNASVGQSTIGFVTSTSYQAGIGYWYGTGASAPPLCDCPFQSDFDEDGFLTAIDLAAMIDVLFAGSPDVQDPNCPNPRADFDCDGFSTALDLSGLIDHLFAGGNPPCDPCNP